MDNNFHHVGLMRVLRIVAKNLISKAEHVPSKALYEAARVM